MQQINLVLGQWFCLLLVFLIPSGTVFSQHNPSADIEKAIAENKLEVAQQLTEKQVGFFYNNRQPDSLNQYIFYTGKIKGLQTGAAEGVKAVQALVQKINSLSSSPKTLRNTYLEAAQYFDFAGKTSLAYKAQAQGYEYGLQVKGISNSELALSQNNLSTCAQADGNVALAQTHAHEAIRYVLTDPKPDFEVLYNAYQGMGTMMYYASRYDSAEHYFQKALEALTNTAPSAMNRFYRPAVIQNSLAGVYGVRGKPTEGINAMKLCIAHLKKFIASKEPDAKKSSAVAFQFRATDNLAGIYKELGDYRQAHDLLSYSYQQKQKSLGQEHPGVFISEVLLGQLYYAMKEHDKARNYLTSALQRMSVSGGDHLFWQADAYYTLALIEDVKGREKEAAPYYEKADSLYETSLQGQYDNIYLEFLRNAALYYAENKMVAQAMKKASKGYNYIIKTEGNISLPHFYQLLNFSEMHFAIGNYGEALNYSEKALRVVNAVAGSAASLLDSVLVQVKKPGAVLLRSRSAYNLLPVKNVDNLTGILNDLKEALQIVETRKAVLSDPGDIGLMMSDQNDLVEFIKTVTLDLYNLTGREQFADELISLHESAIYNRIRSRLDKSAAQFASLPADLQQQEKDLKSAMANALNGKGSHDEVMQQYIHAEENWNRFLSRLRTDYPKYYKMRYASIFRSIGEVQSGLPQNTTVIRYFFVGNELLALVLDREQKKLFRLKTDNLEQHIVSLLKFSTDAKKTGALLHALYSQLWLPIATNIRHNKVVIIPDGILYKLNFEILTPSIISRLEDLAGSGLLAKHIISYQYSLFLVAQQENTAAINGSYVAFAPGFSDEVKQQYRRSRDSLDYDNSYLSLLPQPFTISLAAKTRDLFGGNAYLYNESTLHSFKDKAGQHKIIYIGTHAEADNLHPEYSKLIFAKNLDRQEDSNFLYLFDIYNCDLRSNLTVLTACETGVPGYQDGEGMISLAHAFNYAGSESIITGLWKIDEKASTVIMELFYKNIGEGMAKDEALRKAKLDYLKSAQGRTLSPEYWSGLVLIGNVEPIAINRENERWWILLLVLLGIAGGAFYWRKRLNPA